ncbi:MAG: hypothetical protein U5K53_09755 [Halanaerobiales bacterium]|nr:hypothetical protein [Halanaerobiales bacterium]
MRKSFKLLSIFIVVELILQGAWEYAVCGVFYTMEGLGFIEHQLLMISATIGDVFIGLGLFIVLAYVNKNINWLLDTWERKDYVIIILYSILIAFYFEAHALHIDRWGYKEIMPLFPGTSLALLPVIQLIILIPLGLFLTKKIYKYKFKNSND